MIKVLIVNSAVLVWISFERQMYNMYLVFDHFTPKYQITCVQNT